MSINIRSLVRNAYVTAGVVSDYDDEVDGNRISAAIGMLNSIIAKLNTMQLFPFTKQVVEHTMASESREVSVGPTGNIVAEWPQFIDSIVYQSSADGSGRAIMQTDLASLVSVRSSSSGTPLYYAYAPNLENGKIYLSCKITSGTLLTLIYNVAIPSVTIESNLNIPPHYENLLMYALARDVGVREKVPSLNLERCDKLYNEAESATKTANGRNQIPTSIAGAACGDIQSGWWL